MGATIAEPVAALLGRLRAAGLIVPIGSVLAFTEALSLLEDDTASVYWAGRATLAHSETEIALYDAVFRSWILGDDPDGQPMVVSVPVPVARVVDEGDDAAGHDDGDDGDERGDEPPSARASRAEVLRSLDLARLDPAERSEIDRLLARLRPSAETRRSRRRRPSRRPVRRADDRPDLRRTVRAALRTGGEAIERPSTRRIETPRRVVLLVDVSGSMETYSRALVRFAHAAVRARAKVEVFTLGTRLTRLTRELATVDPDVALSRAAAAVPDWSGGTRLGDGLRAFNDQWGTKGMARGAVVVLLSDGWDRGEPEELAVEMARLSRVAHRVVWVNPLRASPGYEPIARGMAAALPYVDDFVDGHSFDALEDLAAVLARPTPVRSGRERHGVTS